MHDFSASNRSLTELIGKRRGIDEDWKPGDVFRQLLAVESELNGESPKARRELVCRDLAKLCLVRSDLKVVVYPGYEEGETRQLMLDAILRTIERCFEERPISGAWLFIGLLGAWPQQMSICFHVLNCTEHRLELMSW